MSSGQKQHHCEVEKWKTQLYAKYRSQCVPLQPNIFVLELYYTGYAKPTQCQMKFKSASTTMLVDEVIFPYSL